VARRHQLEALLAQSQAAKEKKMDSEPKTTVARTASQVYGGLSVGYSMVGKKLMKMNRFLSVCPRQ